ncbi:MAG: hypothetical protein GX076_02220 [Clostridiales bacterium]|nr:hypothetical protein [Clostridiales bacterium]
MNKALGIETKKLRKVHTKNLSRPIFIDFWEILNNIILCITYHAISLLNKHFLAYPIDNDNISRNSIYTDLTVKDPSLNQKYQPDYIQNAIAEKYGITPSGLRIKAIIQRLTPQT